MKNLNGKCAVVTSSSRGIGLACALALAENGADVFMAVRRKEETEKECESYIKKGYRLKPVYFDAVVEESYGKMINEVLSQSGKIDILVNNFGIGRPKEDLNVVDGDKAAFFDIIRLNLGSVYTLSRLAIPHMPFGSSIVNISSIGGLIPDVTRTGYGVSKAAVNNITKQIALQFASKGIRCNAVLPGLTATDAAMNNMPHEFIESFLSHVPLNRMGKPEDIAKAVLFLATDDSSYITGHILPVAGGYGLGTPQYSEWIKQK